jgi:hypothetical protein
MSSAWLPVCISRQPYIEGRTLDGGIQEVAYRPTLDA